MGWFTSSDKDDDQNNSNFFKSNFSSNVNSVSRVCRTDPEDNNFIICKVKETRTQRINGEDVTNTQEREERIPSNNRISSSEQPRNNPVVPFGINFDQNFPSFGSDVRDIENHFRNTLNAFFGGSNMFFNDIFREVDQAFGQFSEMNQPFESQPRPEQRFENFNNFPQNMASNHGYNNTRSQYNHNFKKTPTSEKDIFDV